MLQEKPNESLNWKNKLDDLDHLQGEARFDKNQAWEKLHLRLGGKSRRTMPRWYWTAAACLMLMMVTQWFLLNEEDSYLIKDTRRQNPVKALIPAHPVSDSVAVAFYQQKVEKHAVSAKVNKTKRHLSIEQAIVKNTHVFSEKKVLSVILPEAHNISVNPDTIGFVAATPIIRKLRIIHINSLDKPGQEQVQSLRSNPAIVFQAKPFNQDVFSGFEITRNASDNLIKIKLPPSN